LVDEEDIIRVAKLMKIDLGHQESDEQLNKIFEAIEKGVPVEKSSHPAYSDGRIPFKFDPVILPRAGYDITPETINQTTAGGSENVNRVKKMLEYFDILDQVDLSAEEIISQEKTLDELRKDEFIPYDKKLIESLKNFREYYVRAPKMN